MAWGATLVQIAGMLIVIAALIQVSLLVASATRHRAYQNEQHRLSLELMHQRVKAAEAHRRGVQERSETTWNGQRKFEIRRKVQEGGGICSFYLAPHDHKPLAPFKPGQYLTFQLKIPDQKRPTIRCYSLSDSFRKDHYRVSIKKIPPPRDKPESPSGLSSSFFHDQLSEGDILDVKAPSGHFFLDMDKETPVVLIGGGVGVTPMLSMLNAIVDSGSQRETWFFYGVRNSSEHIMKEHLERVAREYDNVHLQVCYSKPGPQDNEGQDYQFEERVSVDLFKRVLPSNNYGYYICGPGPLMDSLTKGLRDWGVSDAHVHFEAFGPASVKKTPPPEAAKAATEAGPAVEVTFSRSGQKLPWDPKFESILEFAEEHDIAIESGCRAGNCGTCLTAIKSGEFAYMNEPGFAAEPGTCLTCIAVPKANLTLDA